jgi:hypothetical protein
MQLRLIVRWSAQRPEFATDYGFRYRVNAVLQKYLAKGKLFARTFAKPYQDEDRLRTRFEV